MRAVVVYALVSLDGVAESPETFLDPWDDAVDADLAEVIATQDAVLLGRRSHDEWARFWPGSPIQPFADFINGVRKWVATSSPLTDAWAGATAVEGDLVDFVRDLRSRPGGDIGVHASISVAQALLAADLVDDLRLVVAPTVVGTGRRLFDGVPPMRLRTLASTVSPAGHLMLHLRVDNPTRVSTLPQQL